MKVAKDHRLLLHVRIRKPDRVARVVREDEAGHRLNRLVHHHRVVDGDD